MSVPLGQRYRVALLRGAWQRGPLALADSFLRKKHLVFRLESPALPPEAPADAQGLQFGEARDWEALPQGFRDLVSAPDSRIDWGGRDWFARGWRLWVARKGDQVVALGWWRNAEQTRDFFCPLPEEAELLWHSTVLPGHQGRGLQVVLWVTLMQERARQGVCAFLTNCRDYNTPSRRNIGRMGFLRIGCCTESRLGRRRRWHPEPPHRERLPS